jgi:perosamine synthetase
MMNNFIPVNEPLLKGNEKKYLIECLESNWISSDGPFVKKFEDGLAARLNRKYGIAVTNGTSAIDASIEALGIKQGDEIIVPTFTIISCVLQIIRSGAIPVLIDADPLTWNMDVSAIEEKISHRTKAIMAVHIYGLPVDMDPILNICKKHNLKLIEDAAELIGQTYNNKLCGSFGDISTVSFYSNKHITTGEGGMILTDDLILATKCRELRNLCFQEKKRFFHEKMGWNLRMTNLQAALGLAQLEQLDFFIEKKRWIGKTYNHFLSKIDGLQLPLQSTSYASNIYWIYGLVLSDQINFSSEDAMSYLKEKNIGTRPFFYPIHQQPIFKKMGLFLGQKFPVAEKISRKGFYVPSGLNLSQQQIEKVCVCIYEMMNKFKC